MIYNDTALLSRVHEQKMAGGDLEAAKFVANISPVAWQHVNIFGSFEFTDGESAIDLDVLAAQYGDPEFWQSPTREGADDEATIG
jgi:hypothetical protein